MRRGQKRLNGFKFGDFMVRFPSDGAASLAVKGLNVNLSDDGPVIWTTGV